MEEETISMEIVEEAWTNDTPESIFSRLKPYCVQLLDLLHGPANKSASFLPDLAGLLRRAPPHAIQPYLDFTLLPLLLLVDAAVQCRAGERSGSDAAPLSGRVIGDSVAEGVLACLGELLSKCRLGSVNQMVMVLKKLTSGALLSPSEAAEEFREGVIRCFRVMLLRLEPCSVMSCSCKQICALPSILSIGTSQAHCTSVLKYESEPKECLLAFLQSQDASAAVGHWLSLLLQTAEVEVARGHRGSSSLRKEAFLTLRVLVAKVGSADALAFFLPGIVSRFTKALYVSKSMISGAAGSTRSIEHAVRGLTEFMMIVLSDTANLCGLEMSESDITGSCLNKSKSIKSVLEALRSLPVNAPNQSASLLGNSSSQSVVVKSSKGELKETYNDHSDVKRSLYVHRTKDWINETSAHVDKLLSATFPHLCLHPSEKVRKALVDGIKGLVKNCSYTLKRSKLMLLECLCVLVCDDSATVCLAAQESLEFLFSSGERFLIENEISEIFTRLIDALPRVVLGSEETVAVSHAQRLLALMYYAGPDLVVNLLLSSPMKAAHFLDILGQCLNHNSQFAGSVDKLVKSKPFSVGYLLSVAELKTCSLFSDTSCSVDIADPVVPKISVVHDKDLESPEESIQGDYEFPRMPPWFVNIGSQKLYVALAGILRLVGLSILAENRSDISLMAIIDIPLENIRTLISELRIKEYKKELWQTWYSQSGSGQLLRRTSSAVCILNEIIYGLSGQSVSSYTKLFRKACSEAERLQEKEIIHDYGHPGGCHHNAPVWRICQGKDARDHVIQCVCSILHEYTSHEVWDLPIDQSSPFLEHETGANLSLYFFRDTMMLHQVIIEGIGIFSITLGNEFMGSGFMQSCIYLLLQNLIRSSSQIRSASDAVLQLLSASSGHSSVGHMVVANADYIIDSLCRQLRHLDLNPHVPDVLAAMLSYIGAAHEILALLEEPMRAVSSELEVLGRHQHPDSTIPFLKAVREITKASRYEACRLPNKSESFHAHVKSKAHDLQTREKENHMQATPNARFGMSEKGSANPSDADLQLEYWEELFFKLNEMRRYRRTIGSLVESCLKVANPLLASMKESACLVALDIVEDVTISLANVEEAYKHEKETKMEIERLIQLCSFNDLEDTMDAADVEADENRLLPAMNKIWPYLILCLKNKLSVAVIMRCTSALSTSVQVCGGNFFIRRFRSDGPVIWKLLSSSPFRRKLLSSKDERQLLLPYRSTSRSLEDPMAEVSNIKIQAAVLNMITELSSNKRSASALVAVLKKISGLVVGIAFSNVTGLRDASIKALSGLACIDSDLIWLLVADVYYSLKEDIPPPPTSDLPEIAELLPPSSSKEYLYVQYGGESLGFDLDSSSAEVVFQKLQSEVFV